MSFLQNMQSEALESFNSSITENGAEGYKTTGKSLLDINFAVSSLRDASDNTICDKFDAAFGEDNLLALKWLFFARDVRGGLGERRLFRCAMANLASTNEDLVAKLIWLIPEYGRFDDVYSLLGISKNIDEIIFDMINKVLTSDIKAMKAKKPVTLLAKWLPSCNTSSPQTKAYAKIIRTSLCMSEPQYRKTLVALRKYLDVVEVKMSARKWSDIDYSTVPSRANIIYKDAFMKHDTDRRQEFLTALENGEVKINSSVLYPHEIVTRYSNFRHGTDETLEALWKALPDEVAGCGNTIVVADGSGSMVSTVGNTQTTCLDVANALSIYFSERSSGEFKNKYITFSCSPQFVEFKDEMTLAQKLKVARRHNEVANTNIEAVFDLILKTAVKSHAKQEDIPANILIISDMEFDNCTQTSASGSWAERRPNNKLFKIIQSRFENEGYKLPRLVFWNVCSRTGTIPVRENELGVALVSGFSVNICKMVMSGKLDPFECLLETLNSERYKPVEDAIRR